MTDRKTRTPGLVSVILVNYRGSEDTIACLRAFDDVDWPRADLELIVVENASGDDSAERIRAAAPDVTLIESPINAGFAGGCNVGVKASSGEIVAFINNDARPDSQWIRAAVAAFRADSSVGSVASKVLDWEGTSIDYVDGSLTWYGMGYKRETEKKDTGEWNTAKDVLFGTGSALFCRAAVFEEVGAFDERYFMFYEDVDLGWRMNLLGWRVRYVPTSIAFHKHHASIEKFGNFRETFLLERNGLLSLFKNYEDETLQRVLPAALALMVTRGVDDGDLDPWSLDLQRSPGGDEHEYVEVPKRALARFYAVDTFVEMMSSLAETRAELQQRRRRSDLDLLPLFRNALEPAFPLPRYLDAHQRLVDIFGIAEAFTARYKIVVITGDVVASKMAGPAIRAWHIAQALAAEHNVRLVSMKSARTSHPDFEVSSVSTPDGLRRHEQWADIIIFQGFAMAVAPWLEESEKVIVCDVYDPMHLELLEQSRGTVASERDLSIVSTTRALNVQLSRGDFFLCASEKQRHFWLGQLAGLGRLNASTYDHDSSMNSLLAVVPFGMNEAPPVRTRRAIKGVVDGIGPNDKVILWAGGVYNWFDPVSLIEAIDELRHTRPDIRLFFLGMKNPNPDVPEMHMAVEARRLSDRLGLTDKFVYFNSDWVDFNDRQNYLLDADVGVSTHFDHVETTFSFRTRMLDYLWASLPIVATGGDTFGDLVRSEGLGVTVSEKDVPALAAALDRVLYDEEFRTLCRTNIERVAPQYTWGNALRPLLEFCRAPHRASDAGDVNTFIRPSKPVQKTSVRGDAALLREYFSAGGPTEVARRAYGRIRRKIRERADA